jgi:ATP-dependent Lon protease
VRNLQREISKVCRKVAMSVAEFESAAERAVAPVNGRKPARAAAAKKSRTALKRPAKVNLTPENVEEYLGKKKSFQEVAERMGRPGVAIGLAWTQVGGAILFIEAARYPGDGALKLTGQLGEVMKESAQAALTYLRANHHRLRHEPRGLQEVRVPRPRPRRRHAEGRTQRRCRHRHRARQPHQRPSHARLRGHDR